MIRDSRSGGPVLAVLAAALLLASCANPLKSLTGGEGAGGRSDSARALAPLGSFNYGEALQKAIMFYEFQRSGDIDPATSRNNWRGDSGLSDGSDVGVDLTGGWYDAGDHVKFNLPMAYTVAMLSWTAHEYHDALSASGQLSVLLENIKWATDYLIRCHTAPNEFYYQVGAGGADHAWWGPAEVMPMARPAYKVTLASPGSAVVGEAAAALAAASVVFNATNPTYAATLRQHAQELFTFADTTKSDAGYTAANGFYNSWSGYWDELSWAAAWLYITTGTPSYLTKAEDYVSHWGTEGNSSAIAYTWAHNWDDVHYGAAVLLARLTQDSAKRQLYKTALEQHLEYWRTSIPTTPLGLAWLSQWGSLRYATTTAFIANVYTKWSGADQTKVALWRDWAASQVDYALGSTGRSFVVGFGVNPPQHPHHRTAHSSWTDQLTFPTEHRHTIVGALVGGPGSQDQYSDTISDYVMNEVATDYNAGLVGALAATYARYGGTPVPNLNAIETIPGPEFFTLAAVNASGSNFLEIKGIINNTSGWPARASSNLNYRYFINLSELIAAGYSASNVTVTTNYNQGAVVTGPLVHDAANHIYYVLVNFAGTNIYPGGQNAYKKEVQFRMSYPMGVTWNSANDWSFQGVSTSANSPSLVVNIPVYEGSTKLSGETPGGGGTGNQAPLVSLTAPAAGTVFPTGAAVTVSAQASDVDGTVAQVAFFAGNTLIAEDTAAPYSAVWTAPAAAGTVVLRAVATDNQGLSASSQVSVVVQSSNPQNGISAVYTKNDWGSGFTGTIRLTNTTTQAISQWRLTFTFGGNQTISNYWSAAFVQSGQSVQATPLSWNTTIQPGQSIDIGFNASYSGTNAIPTDLTVQY